MSLPLQLRIYTLKSASAAAAFVPRWRHVSSSLAQHHAAQTLAVYTSPTSPEKVIALVQFAERADPVAVMKEYVSSARFKDDMGDVQKGDFVGVSDDVVESVEF